MEMEIRHPNPSTFHHDQFAYPTPINNPIGTKTITFMMFSGKSCIWPCSIAL